MRSVIRSKFMPTFFATERRLAPFPTYLMHLSSYFRQTEADRCDCARLTQDPGKGSHKSAGSGRRGNKSEEEKKQGQSKCGTASACKDNKQRSQTAMQHTTAAPPRRSGELVAGDPTPLGLPLGAGDLSRLSMVSVDGVVQLAAFPASLAHMPPTQFVVCGGAACLAANGGRG